VGGSSGGEGCIVSAAGSVCGIGSDIGGSIRMPAFFNGVYGHKPSPRLVSNDRQHPPATGLQDIMLGTGPICRYVTPPLPFIL
jgi:fatty acid amide hydrolase 2